MKPDTPVTLTFLGTGTSTGVPQVGCNCRVCTSADSSDNRLRASALVSVAGGNILIDCGPDLRQQLLHAGSPRIDAVLVTHSHYDHVGGIDDLRPMCHLMPGGEMPLYCREDVDRDLRAHFPYCFARHPYPGVPRFDVHVVEPHVPVEVAGAVVSPLPVLHGKLPILGYRIGSSLAYITDCSSLGNDVVESLAGIDTLVINALRIGPHFSHMSLAEALDVVRAIAPRQTYLTHMSHQIGLHADVMRDLPATVHLAFDGLTVHI